MKIEKILIWFGYIMFCIDYFIDKEETNYNAWIVLFLFWIALNTVSKKNNYENKK
tara:strand:- start:58 stop:222 length:165 start_codon:yes stop_codon:yes gene_type:complete